MNARVDHSESNRDPSGTRRPGAVSVVVAVFSGGASNEREVSVQSGAAVAAALTRLGHRVVELDPGGGGWRLAEPVDVVFLALHGAYGEDGGVQAELDRMGIPYTGCGVQASRIAFDKAETKRRCAAAGVRTARFAEIGPGEGRWPAELRPPVVLKPVRGGSSVGLVFLDETEGWDDALARARSGGDFVLVEERVFGREITVGILNGRPLPIVEVKPRGGCYDFHHKYTAGATEYLCPAPFSPEQTRQLQETAMAAFEAIDGRDYARVDLIVRESGEALLLEINTLPGMTETSLLPQAAAAAGISFESLCDRMLRLALERRSRDVRLSGGGETSPLKSTDHNHSN